MAESARSKRAGLGALALFAALLVINGGAAFRDCRQLRPVHEGEVAPEFSLPTVTQKGRLGPTLALSSLRGDIVVLDFWATWCGPCKASMPVLETIATKYADRGVRVLSINTEGTGAAKSARSMANRLAPSLELLVDTGVASALYKVNTIPHMLIVDRAGTVRWVHRGMGTAKGLRRDLERAIEALL